MWSAAVLEPALPLRSIPASGSPVPAPPWSTNASSGWNPNPRLNVGAACSFSEWAVTRVASTSITSGTLASMNWSGARSPASVHARARADARAVSIAARTAVASPANAAIVRDTVASEATSPYTPGSARSTATSARQSPPSANPIAKSVTTLPGSCTANGLRHGANPADRSWPRPVTAAVSVSRTPPA